MLKYSASRISSTCFETTLAPLEYGMVAMRATIFDTASSRSTRTSPGTGRPPSGWTILLPSSPFESLQIPFELPDETHDRQTTLLEVTQQILHSDPLSKAELQFGSLGQE